MVNVSLSGELIGSIRRIQIAASGDCCLSRERRVALALRELLVLVVVVTKLRLREGSEESQDLKGKPETESIFTGNRFFELKFLFEKLYLFISCELTA